jgi:hypothetical protein
MMPARSFLPASVLVLALAGCAATPPAQDDTAQREMLALLMPSRIEIVEPFTQVKSFDDAAALNGIELLLQAVNSLGSRGLPIVGHVRVELFEHLPASGQRKGQRIEHWEISLADVEQQRRYWNDVTQMYKFMLLVDEIPVPVAETYVLAVTYNSPLGEHLTSECLISYRLAPRPLGGPGTGRP